MSQPQSLLPLDEHNRLLLANVRPPDWVNPPPADRYNLVAIGAGTAGLVASAGAALIGGRAALVERALLGGDCLVTGCVPSKTLIRSARAVADIARARDYGIAVEGAPRVDFARVMERLRRVRAEISPHDSVAEFTRRGVDVFLGEARFLGPDRVAVGDTVLRFRKAVIATGARPAHPEIPGLAEAGFLTSETVFSLSTLPPRLAVVGGGPIGCELAQAFRRLGSTVTLLQRPGRILEHEDPEAAGIIAAVFAREGVTAITGCTIERVEHSPGGKVLHYRTPAGAGRIEVDAILVGAGRQPNVEGLGLEEAGVRYDGKRGVIVDDTLRTSNPNIYACGDVSMRWKFTHAADAAARLVVENALAFGRKKLSDLVMPWCTYTDPEIAHVGLTPEEAEAQGISVETIRVPLTESDRALADGESEGFVKIHLRRGSERIVGATIVARHAGEMIGEITLAMTAKLGLSALARAIHPYPTQAEAIRKAADEYALRKLEPLTKFTRLWLAWRR